MDYKKKLEKVIVISGKARAGKDTTAVLMKELYEKSGKSVIVLQFSSTIKDYAKIITDWDGSDESKPREFLQVLGTDIIRKNIDEKFFIKRMIQDILVYSYFYDVVIISDVRFKFEIESIRNSFQNVVSINVKRPLYDAGLTIKQESHPSEVDLDNYSGYDYEIINDGSLDDLKEKVVDIVKNL